ncbi:MAG: hypothetical protein ACLRRU_08095 [Faecalibacterium sp.]
MNRTHKFRQGLLLALAMFTAVLVFAAPQRCADALHAGLVLCGGPLLVSLFPFLIVSALLMGCGAGPLLGFAFQPAARVIGVRAKAAGSVLLIGFLGGFAPAAAAAAQAVRTGQLTPRQASALLPACVCSGPSFVILTVGEQMLGSRALGVRLFAAQLLAGYLTAAVLCRMQGGAGQCLPAKAEEILLPTLDAVVAQAAVTYLKLCGFVLYFRLLAAGAKALLPKPWSVLPAMLLEVCSGCDCASRTGLWASTALLCSPQHAGSLSAFAGAYYLPAGGVTGAIAGRAGAASALVTGTVLAGDAGDRTGCAGVQHPVRAGGGHAPRAAGLRAAGLCRVLHYCGRAAEEVQRTVRSTP